VLKISALGEEHLMVMQIPNIFCIYLWSLPETSLQVLFFVISRGYYRWSGLKLLELFPCGDSLTLETFSKEWPQDCNFRGTL
jgi:hypothetical protein